MTQFSPVRPVETGNSVPVQPQRSLDSAILAPTNDRDAWSAVDIFLNSFDRVNLLTNAAHYFQRNWELNKTFQGQEDTPGLGFSVLNQYKQDFDDTYGLGTSDELAKLIGSEGTVDSLAKALDHTLAGRKNATAMENLDSTLLSTTATLAGGFVGAAADPTSWLAFSAVSKVKGLATAGELAMASGKVLPTTAFSVGKAMADAAIVGGLQNIVAETTAYGLRDPYVPFWEDVAVGTAFGAVVSGGIAGAVAPFLARKTATAAKAAQTLVQAVDAPSVPADAVGKAVEASNGVHVAAEVQKTKDILRPGRRFSDPPDPERLTPDSLDQMWWEKVDAEEIPDVAEAVAAAQLPKQSIYLETKKSDPDFYQATNKIAPQEPLIAEPVNESPRARFRAFADGELPHRQHLAKQAEAELQLRGEDADLSSRILNMEARGKGFMEEGFAIRQNAELLDDAERAAVNAEKRSIEEDVRAKLAAITDVDDLTEFKAQARAYVDSLGNIKNLDEAEAALDELNGFIKQSKTEDLGVEKDYDVVRDSYIKNERAIAEQTKAITTLRERIAPAEEMQAAVDELKRLNGVRKEFDLKTARRVYNTSKVQRELVKSIVEPYTKNLRDTIRDLKAEQKLGNRTNGEVKTGDPNKPRIGRTTETRLKRHPSGGNTDKITDEVIGPEGRPEGFAASVASSTEVDAVTIRERRNAVRLMPDHSGNTPLDWARKVEDNPAAWEDLYASGTLHPNEVEMLRVWDNTQYRHMKDYLYRWFSAMSGDVREFIARTVQFVVVDDKILMQKRMLDPGFMRGSEAQVAFEGFPSHAADTFVEAVNNRLELDQAGKTLYIKGNAISPINLLHEMTHTLLGIVTDEKDWKTLKAAFLKELGDGKSPEMVAMRAAYESGDQAAIDAAYKNLNYAQQRFYAYLSQVEGEGLLREGGDRHNISDYSPDGHTLFIEEWFAERFAEKTLSGEIDIESRTLWAQVRDLIGWVFLKDPQAAFRNVAARFTNRLKKNSSRVSLATKEVLATRWGMKHLGSNLDQIKGDLYDAVHLEGNVSGHVERMASLLDYIDKNVPTLRDALRKTNHLWSAEQVRAAAKADPLSLTNPIGKKLDKVLEMSGMERLLNDLTQFDKLKRFYVGADKAGEKLASWHADRKSQENILNALDEGKTVEVDPLTKDVVFINPDTGVAEPAGKVINRDPVTATVVGAMQMGMKGAMAHLENNPVVSDNILKIAQTLFFDEARTLGDIQKSRGKTAAQMQGVYEARYYELMETVFEHYREHTKAQGKSAPAAENVKSFLTGVRPEDAKDFTEFTMQIVDRMRDNRKAQPSDPAPLKKAYEATYQYMDRISRDLVRAKLVTPEQLATYTDPVSGRRNYWPQLWDSNGLKATGGKEKFVELMEQDVTKSYFEQHRVTLTPEEAKAIAVELYDTLITRESINASMSFKPKKAPARVGNRTITLSDASPFFDAGLLNIDFKGTMQRHVFTWQTKAAENIALMDNMGVDLKTAAQIKTKSPQAPVILNSKGMDELAKEYPRIQKKADKARTVRAEFNKQAAILSRAKKSSRITPEKMKVVEKKFKLAKKKWDKQKLQPWEEAILGNHPVVDSPSRGMGDLLETPLNLRPTAIDVVKWEMEQRVPHLKGSRITQAALNPKRKIVEDSIEALFNRLENLEYVGQDTLTAGVTDTVTQLARASMLGNLAPTMFGDLANRILYRHGEPRKWMWQLSSQLKKLPPEYVKKLEMIVRRHSPTHLTGEMLSDSVERESVVNRLQSGAFGKRGQVLAKLNQGAQFLNDTVSNLGFVRFIDRWVRPFQAAEHYDNLIRSMDRLIPVMEAAERGENITIQYLRDNGFPDQKEWTHYTGLGYTLQDLKILKQFTEDSDGLKGFRFGDLEKKIDAEFKAGNVQEAAKLQDALTKAYGAARQHSGNVITTPTASDMPLWHGQHLGRILMPLMSWAYGMSNQVIRNLPEYSMKVKAEWLLMHTALALAVVGLRAYTSGNGAKLEEELSTPAGAATVLARGFLRTPLSTGWAGGLFQTWMNTGNAEITPAAVSYPFDYMTRTGAVLAQIKKSMGGEGEFNMSDPEVQKKLVSWMQLTPITNLWWFQAVLNGVREKAETQTTTNELVDEFAR